MVSKNEKMRESFHAFCLAHPEYRFFQALRNWVQENVDADINFIFFGGDDYNQHIWNGDYEEAAKLIMDTWNIEDDRLG